MTAQDPGPGVIVVGTGFGVRVHVPALRAAGFHVRALVGRDPDKTRRRAQRVGVEHALVSLDDALGLPGVEAVTIATPPSTHEWITLAALDAGKHVLCEKPLALDAREARRMHDAARDAAVIALVGHEFRWSTESAVVMRAIADGRIGEPRTASLVGFVPLVADPSTRTPDWWFDPAWGGGWLGASGSHAVDQIRVWLGEFASVSATLSLTSSRDEAAEDTFTLRFQLENGVDGILQQTSGAWGEPGGLTRVAGTRGTVWIDAGGAWLADRDGTRRLSVPPDLGLPAVPAASDDPRHQFTHLELGPYIRLCEALRAGIDGVAPRNASAVPVPSFLDGLATVEVLDAIRASARAGGALVELGLT